MVFCLCSLAATLSMAAWLLTCFGSLNAGKVTRLESSDQTLDLYIGRSYVSVAWWRSTSRVEPSQLGWFFTRIHERRNVAVEVLDNQGLGLLSWGDGLFSAPEEQTLASYTSASIHLGPLSAFFAAYPAVALARRRSLARLSPHQCPACKYDLRSTADPAGPLFLTCPECGHTAPTPHPSA